MWQFRSVPCASGAARFVTQLTRGVLGGMRSRLLVCIHVGRARESYGSDLRQSRCCASAPTRDPRFGHKKHLSTW
jgi:hypothetical protein